MVIKSSRNPALVLDQKRPFPTEPWGIGVTATLLTRRLRQFEFDGLHV